MKKRKFYLEDPGIIWIWWTPLRSQRKNIPNSLPRWWNLCHIHISPTFSGWNISNKNCFETTYTPAPMNRYWGPKMKVSNSSSNHHFSGTNYSSLDLLAPKKAPLFSHLCHHPQARSIEKKKNNRPLRLGLRDPSCKEARPRLRLKRETRHRGYSFVSPMKSDSCGAKKPWDAKPAPPRMQNSWDCSP